MCGIVGYIGDKQAAPIVIKGLKRLEYRGYDSAGIATLNGQTKIYKCKGKVSDLENHIGDQSLDAKIAMGHTRWATHGEPNDTNAHPHVSQNGEIVLIHNGIIENYSRLREDLENEGYEFKSDTDTEVLANLIEYVYLKDNKQNIEDAVNVALTRVVGAYGLVIASYKAPDQLIAVRKASPLVLGIGEGEYFLASDASPIIEYTNKVIYLNNDDMAVIKRDEFTIKNLKNKDLTPKIQELNLTLGEIEKGGYDHFMLKEIYEQPRRITDTFRGRISADLSEIKLGGLIDVMPKLVEAERVIIIACGTSWHAGLIGEFLIEKYARIPVEVEYASEFRYRNPIINPKDVVIAISQSGETADSLAAIALAKDAGATVLGICNVVGSSIPRETDAGIYTHAGSEIGVASTKAFTTQVTVLIMMALKIGYKKGLVGNAEYKEIIKELTLIPEKIEEILEKNDQIKEIAAKYINVTSSLFIGRGHLYPIALEGALKLKEISYIHAEGYPAAEMKHGPIALIEKNFPVFCVAPQEEGYEKMLSNIQEVKARNGEVISVVTKGDTEVVKSSDYVVEIPETHDALSSLLTIIPLQMISYHIAVMRGCDVDQPRNLAKSVTVE